MAYGIFLMSISFLKRSVFAKKNEVFCCFWILFVSGSVWSETRLSAVVLGRLKISAVRKQGIYITNCQGHHSTLEHLKHTQFDQDFGDEKIHENMKIWWWKFRPSWTQSVWQCMAASQNVQPVDELYHQWSSWSWLVTIIIKILVIGMMMPYTIIIMSWSSYCQG